ncbi:unnamed protein product [Orchesella dallaii]|uniref:MYND-type domain-containing protein n=1 Tax=Orchesella dallaii TaxID=48710 RepID=A0ABP1RC28_9HEXA
MEYQNLKVENNKTSTTVATNGFVNGETVSIKESYTPETTSKTPGRTLQKTEVGTSLLGSDTDSAHSNNDDPESDMNSNEDIEDLYADVRTGVPMIDQAMRQLNSKVYPKLSHQSDLSLLLRGLKKDLDFPLMPFPVVELVRDIESNEDESEKLYQLAMHLMYGKEMERDLMYAVILLKRVAKMDYFDPKTTRLNTGVGKAQVALAALHILGVGVMQSFFVASFWYQRSLTHVTYDNLADAKLRNATLHLVGLGTFKSWEIASETFNNVEIKDPNVQKDMFEVYTRNVEVETAIQYLHNLRSSYSEQELKKRGIKIQSLDNKLHSQGEKFSYLYDGVEAFERLHSLNHDRLTLPARHQRRLRAIKDPYKTLLKSEQYITDLVGTHVGVRTNLKKLLYAALNGSPSAEVVLQGELNGFELLKYLPMKKHTDEDKKLMLSLCYGRIPYSKPWSQEILRKVIKFLKEDIRKVIIKEKNSEAEHYWDRKWRISVGYHQTLLLESSTDEHEQLELFLKQTVERYPADEKAYQTIALFYFRKGMYTESMQYTLKGLNDHPQDLYLLSLKANNLFHMSINDKAETSIKLRERQRNNYAAVKACEEFLCLAPDCHIDATVMLKNLRQLLSCVLDEAETSKEKSTRNSTLTWTAHCNKLMLQYNAVGSLIHFKPHDPRDSFEDGVLQIQQLKMKKIYEPNKHMKNDLKNAENTMKGVDFIDLDTNRKEIITYHRQRIKNTSSRNNPIIGRVNLNSCKESENFEPFTKQIPSSYRESDLIYFENGREDILMGLFLTLTIIDDPYVNKSNIQLVAQDRLRRCCLVVIEGNASNDKALIKNLKFGVKLAILDPRISVNCLAGKFLQVKLDDPGKCVEFSVLNNACRTCLEPHASYHCSKCFWAKYCSNKCKSIDLRCYNHNFICVNKVSA